MSRGRWRWGGSRTGEGVDNAVSRCCRVAHKIGKVRRNFGNVGQGAASHIDYGRNDEGVLGVPTSSCPHLKPIALEQGSQP